MKKFFVVCLLMSLMMPSFAQDAATANENSIKNVIFGDLQYSAKNSLGSVITGALQGRILNQEASYLSALRSGIIKGLSSVGRFSVKDEDMNDFVSDCDRSGKQGLVVNGTVSELGTFYELKSSIKHYTGVATVTLNFTDVKTNEILWSRKFSESRELYLSDATPDQAMGGAIDYITYDIFKCCSSIYPITGQVIEKGNEKKDKMKELYIDIGNNWGIGKDRVFRVYYSEIIAGRTARKEVGRIKVISVEGEDISLCKIVKGGENIKTLMDKNAKLTVVSE